MDAYDIFKKLTKGLTFKHRVLGVKNNDYKIKPMLKNEDIKNDIDLKRIEDEIELKQEIESNDSGSQTESHASEESEDELQILEGVRIEKKKDKTKKKSKLDPEKLKKKLELEEHNRFRNEHGIKVVGRHVPCALKDFNELVSRYNVSKALVDTVVQCGYTEPTPIQRQALPCLLEGRQIVATAPTGSGKTAAFLLPLFHILGAPQGGPRALVLCPTRELAHQIYREALRLSASTQLRCSVVKSVKQSKVKERESTIRKSDVIISTPNRLCYLLNQDNVGISLDKVQWLIVDEADKMFEGSVEEVDTFRQQLDVITRACSAKLAMFSATHTPALAKWARHNMRGLINLTVGHRNAAASSVQQELVFCGNESGKLLAFRQLVQRGLRPPVLVFVQSKDRAKQLFKELLYDGINVDVIHADRTQAQRDNVVRSFRVGRIWVLICTELMGRGMDFRGVNLVINYDFPPSAIAYIHRVGRAGRAGATGRAVTFFTQDDVANLRSIASVMRQSGCAVPEYMLAMKQDPNKRKQLMKRALRRDKISTVLEKPDKRKLDKETPDSEKAKTTEEVKSGKNKKLRRIENNNKEGKKSKKQLEKGKKIMKKKKKPKNK
ncbi:probable ATP-dependent RNA helicase DDX52 [Leptidea sinapis]|uniref:probable ATP-dependent RNA helicase DDX52 n=1 Tax=Leptidea sinapis TaxID=189913 RepID=UPI00212B5ADB|nr:probable ATP-dependent RNA helicase DDX52 [Leptidea sinapis]